MISMQQQDNGRVLEVAIQGKLHKSDYAQHMPYVEGLIAKLGKLSVLVDLRQFQGWELGALWEDMKFDARHFRDIDRVAFVGEKRWQKLMAGSCKPFTTAQVRFFPVAELEQARDWVRQSRWDQQAAA